MSENLIGATTAVFPIRLSVAVTSPVDVEWATRDGSAIAGSDYKAASGTVTFLPGETEKQIEVQVYGQAITPADDRVFFIRLNPPSNAVLVDAILTCTINIIDDQGIPSVAVVVAEGRRGPKGNPGLSAYEQAVLMGYTGTVEQWMDEIGDASQAAERAKSFTSQAIESAVVAGQKADEAVDAVGSTKQYVDGALASQSVYLDSKLANQTQTVNSALSDLSTAANKFYPTLAAANDDISNIQVDQPVTIGESANGGLWYKETIWASSLTKSAYDPLTQAKNYTDANFSKGRSVISSVSTLFNYQQNGSYFGAANTTLTDAPSDRDAAKDFIFSVESIIDTDRYKQQTYKETVTGKIWFRTIDLQNNVVRRDWARSQVDDAAITTAKLANKAASRPKLSDNFLFNEVLTTGLISDARKDGLYFGTAQNHTDIPTSGLSPANSFILEVKDITGLGRFIYQKLIRYAALDREWWRIVDTQNPSTAVWTRTYSLVDAAVTTAMLAGKAVTGEKLADNYRYKALINSGSTRDIVADGTYLVVAATTADNPPQIIGNYLLIVENISSSSYVNQRAIQLSDGSKTAARTIRPAQNIYYDWKAPDAGQVNQFAGKKIAFLGDSITEFGTYPQQVANILGATALNMGIGGTRLGFHSLPNYDELSGYKIAKAINTGNFTPLETAAANLIISDNDDNTVAVNLIKTTDWSTVDYLVVGYGTNDFGGNRPVGIYTENLSDGSTFAGAANYFIQMIQSKYPQIKIVFTTPIWRKKTPMAQSGIDGGSDVSPNTLGKYLIEYADELIKVAQANHVEVLDLHSKSGINHLTAGKYIGDGVHPTVDGYSLLAKKLSGFLRSSF